MQRSLNILRNRLNSLSITVRENPAAAAHDMRSVPFKELAIAFEKLERTSSSTAMIDILARFLPKLSPQETGMTAYLLSGKVGPSFSAPEFGMAEKMIVRVIAHAGDIPAARVQRMLAKSGDVGEVAAATRAGRGTGMTIACVFGTLQSKDFPVAVIWYVSFGSPQIPDSAIDEVIRTLHPVPQTVAFPSK